MPASRRGAHVDQSLHPGTGQQPSDLRGVRGAVTESENRWWRGTPLSVCQLMHVLTATSAPMDPVQIRGG